MMLCMRKIRKKICKYLCPKTKWRDVVLVFPYDTKEKKMLIMQEYIQHYKKAFWKITSGGIDKIETSPEQHAIEEMNEELGLESDTWHHVHTTKPYFGARVIHAYVAENPYPSKNPIDNPDDDEILETKWIDETEFLAMLDSGELLWNEGALMALQIFRRYK